MKIIILILMFIVSVTTAYADIIKEKEFCYDFLKEHCLGEDKKHFYVHDESEIIGSELDELDLSASLCTQGAVQDLIKNLKLAFNCGGMSSCSNIILISTTQIEKGFNNLSNILCGSICGSKKLIQYKYENSFWTYDKVVELVKR